MSHFDRQSGAGRGFATDPFDMVEAAQHDSTASTAVAGAGSAHHTSTGGSSEVHGLGELDDILIEDGVGDAQVFEAQRPHDPYRAEEEATLAAPRNPWFSFRLPKLLYGLGSVLSVKVDNRERAELCAYVATPQFVQYCVWRRWLMALLIPVVLADFGWKLHDDSLELDEAAQLTRITSNFTTPALPTYVILVNVTDISLTFAQVLFLCFAFLHSYQWRRSRYLLTYAFVLPYAFIFIQYMLPLTTLFTDSYPSIAANELITQLYDKLRQWACENDPTDTPADVKICLQVLSELLPYLTSLLQPVLKIFFYLYIYIYVIMVDYLEHTGLASLCILPALARGSMIVKKIFPQSSEMGWLARAVPVFFTPLLGFVMLLLVQATGSYMVMGASISLLFALLLPSLFLMVRLVRRVDSVSYFNADLSFVSMARMSLAGLSLTLIIGYLVTSDIARSFITTYVTVAGGIRFVLEFLIKYNLLTIISTDWLIELLICLHDPAIVQSSSTIPTLADFLHHLRHPAVTLHNLSAAGVQSIQGGGSQSSASGGSRQGRQAQAAAVVVGKDRGAYRDEVGDGRRSANSGSGDGGDAMSTHNSGPAVAMMEYSSLDSSSAPADTETGGGRGGKKGSSSQRGAVKTGASAGGLVIDAYAPINPLPVTVVSGPAAASRPAVRAVSKRKKYALEDGGDVSGLDRGLLNAGTGAGAAADAGRGRVYGTGSSGGAAAATGGGGADGWDDDDVMLIEGPSLMEPVSYGSL